MIFASRPVCRNAGRVSGALTLRRRVIFESRYGMCSTLLFTSPRALMTLPRARSPLLMYTDSVSRHNGNRRCLIEPQIDLFRSFLAHSDYYNDLLGLTK